MSTKEEFMKLLWDQAEEQIQFGDQKASLLIAGDAILLTMVGTEAMSTNFTKALVPGGFSFNTVAPLLLSIGFTVCLVISLAYALLAARPATIHNNPPQELFLVSHIARMDRREFIKTVDATSPDDLGRYALETTHGKYSFAAAKFRLLKRSVNATLVSLLFVGASVLIRVVAAFAK